MKAIKEYYDQGKDYVLNWLSHQKEEWWKNKKFSSCFDIRGDYIETVHFLTDDERNDVSFFQNHTNLKNSEWDILFQMMGQATIDWCIKCGWKDVWSINLVIDRIGYSKDYECSIKVNIYDSINNKYYTIKEEDELKKYSGLGDYLCDMLDWFLTKHGKNIPNDWNKFNFGLDDLMDSCMFGQWTCSSDGYMYLAHYDKDTKELTDFVECM